MEISLKQRIAIRILIFLVFPVRWFAFSDLDARLVIEIAGQRFSVLFLQLIIAGAIAEILVYALGYFSRKWFKLSRLAVFGVHKVLSTLTLAIFAEASFIVVNNPDLSMELMPVIQFGIWAFLFVQIISAIVIFNKWRSKKAAYES